MADHRGQHLGPYRLLRLLGKRGIAEVYLAEHGTTGTQIAVKVINIPLTREASESFRMEAHTLSRLAHPHILRVLDAGIEDSIPYLVMPYAPGGSLRQRLPRRTPLAPATILPLIQHVANALQYAHGQRVIHQDIKPENMLLSARGEPLLSDFGLSMLAQSLRQQSAQDVAGTIAYMAPEQIQGRPLPASDQYALGVVTYEWLTGSQPFEGSPREVINGHLAAPAPSLRARVPNLPRALEEVILTALAKDPQARFPSVEAFAQALRQSIDLNLEGQPRRPGISTYALPGESGALRPPASGAPPLGAPPTPPDGGEADPVQRLSIRPRPQSGSSPLSLPQRSSFPASNLASQRGTPPPTPPAPAPRPAAAPTPAPRQRSPGLVVALVILAVIIIAVSGLGVLGVRGSGPLAAFFTSHQTGTPGTGSPNGTTSAAANGKGCTKVGVLMPETNSSPRWEAYDHPLLVQQLEASGFAADNIDYANANGDATTQENQAKADLAKGDCILIVAAHDSLAAAAIVTAARQQQVPVIAYDRFIFSDDLNYYVSFDGIAVGKLQGKYIVDHYKDARYGVSAGHNNIAFINGSPIDNNATLFAQGAHSALDPLITDGILNKVYEEFTPNWDAPTGEKEMQTALSLTKDNIQLVLAANDALGGAVVQALATQKLAGKVLVTGQDATVAGLQRILEGTQAMTVYKPIIKEATGAAQLAAALRDGKDITPLTRSQTIKNPQGNANVPAVLETPIAVDDSNIASTVLADGFVTKSQLCTGLPAGTNTGGICP